VEVVVGSAVDEGSTVEDLVIVGGTSLAVAVVVEVEDGSRVVVGS